MSMPREAARNTSPISFQAGKHGQANQSKPFWQPKTRVSASENLSADVGIWAWLLEPGIACQKEPCFPTHFATALI